MLITPYIIEFLNITSTFLGTLTITLAPASIVIKPRPAIITSRFSLPVSNLTALTLSKSNCVGSLGGVSTEPS